MMSAARAEAAASRADLSAAEREFHEADDGLRAAALRAVEEADARLARAYAAGLLQRTGPPTEGEGRDMRVVVLPLPVEVAGAIEARRTLLERLPLRTGDDDARARWALEVAEHYFLYGHFDEAAPFYRTVWHERCGKDRNGYVAWSRLLDMANLRDDIKQARALADQDRIASCAFDEDQRREHTGCEGRGGPPDPYAEARGIFEQAQKAAGDERVALFRTAAEAYVSAFRSAPARDDAPEGAVNGAYSYGQIGEVDAQIDVLRQFLVTYGDSALRAPLRNSDPGRYHDHITYTGFGMGVLAEALTKRGDVAGAASVLLSRASLDGEKLDERRSAACAALRAFASVHDAKQVAAARRTATGIGAKCPK
jgi:hypothetical protein